MALLESTDICKTKVLALDSSWFLFVVRIVLRNQYFGQLRLETFYQLLLFVTCGCCIHINNAIPYNVVWDVSLQCVKKLVPCYKDLLHLWFVSLQARRAFEVSDIRLLADVLAAFTSNCFAFRNPQRSPIVWYLQEQEYKKQIMGK